MLTTTILPVNVNIYAQNENISKFTFPKGFLESLQKDVSGHYSNPAFGIEDIVFPDGWHGRAIETGFGLLVNMHPGNELRTKNKKSRIKDERFNDIRRIGIWSFLIHHS